MTENQRLKIIRTHLMLTQEAFAASLNLKQGSYSDIERGKVGVSSDILFALNKEHSINIEWVKTGKGSMLIDDSLNSETPLIHNEAYEELKKTVTRQDRLIELLEEENRRLKVENTRLMHLNKQ